MSDEKFGVIVCTDCNKAKAADLSVEKTECPYCGKKLTVSEMKIYFESSSFKETKWAVGRINSKMEGIDEEIEDGESTKLGPYAKALTESSSANDEREKLTIIAQVLTRELDKIGEKEISELAQKSDLGSKKELKEKFRRLDEVFEPENGVFKAV